MDPVQCPGYALPQRRSALSSALPHRPVSTALLVVEVRHRTGGAQFVVPPAADTRDRHGRALAVVRSPAQNAGLAVRHDGDRGGDVVQSRVRDVADMSTEGAGADTPADDSQ